MVVNTERHRPLQPGRAFSEARKRAQDALPRSAIRARDPGAAAKRLYLAAADLSRTSTDPARDWYCLYDPLVEAVSTMRTRAGHLLCGQIAAAYANGRAQEALAHCRELTRIAGKPAKSRWFGSESER